MSTPREVADALTWSLARQCRPKDVLVVGVATPLAAAAGLLARELLTPDLTIIMAASVNPATHDVAESLTDPAAAARRAPGTLTQAEILDAIQRGRVTLQFVSPAEVDAEGRINTNRVGGRRLPGALALPDVAVLVGRLVAYRAGHSPRFLVPRVQYVTGRAGGVRAIVTDKAEIALGARDEAAEAPAARGDAGPVGEAAPPRLVALQPGATEQEARAGCGFALEGDPVHNEPLPQEARELLDRVIDPHEVRLLEIREGRAGALERLARR
jgi:acyl CoA:acetate/3-ketoacid CoA transferase beta subunit